MADALSRRWGLAAAAASGALAALSYPSADQAWLAWVGLVPILAYVRATRGEHVGLPFYLFGVVYFTIGLSWLNPVITVVGTMLLSVLLTFLFLWPMGHCLGFVIRRGYPFAVSVVVVWVA